MTFRYRGDERFRVVHPLNGHIGDATNGFVIVPGPRNVALAVLFSDGGGWEHASVSTKNKRLPNWPELQFVRFLLWSPEDTVIQIHPPEREHRSFAEVLHLWRPVGIEIPLPDPMMVAPPDSDCDHKFVDSYTCLKCGWSPEAADSWIE